MSFDIAKPDNQIIGDGFIVWQWIVLNGASVIESVLSIRDGNPTGVDPGGYTVSMRLPKSDADGDPVYAFDHDAAYVLGQAVMSAHEWKYRWNHVHISVS